jgi:hypothetical protein
VSPVLQRAAKVSHISDGDGGGSKNSRAGGAPDSEDSSGSELSVRATNTDNDGSSEEQDGIEGRHTAAAAASVTLNGCAEARGAHTGGGRCSGPQSRSSRGLGGL